MFWFYATILRRVCFQNKDFKDTRKHFFLFPYCAYSYYVYNMYYVENREQQKLCTPVNTSRLTQRLTHFSTLVLREKEVVSLLYLEYSFLEIKTYAQHETTTHMWMMKSTWWRVRSWWWWNTFVVLLFGYWTYYALLFTDYNCGNFTRAIFVSILTKYCNCEKEYYE